MIGFAKKETNKELQRIIARTLDGTAPNLPPWTGETRWEPRSNRCFPVVLAPFENRMPVSAETVTALTRNFSSRGMAVVLHHPFRAAEVVVGFWLEEQPCFVLGRVKQNTPLGGGFWQLGIELTQVVDLAAHPSMSRMMPHIAHLAAT